MSPSTILIIGNGFVASALQPTLKAAGSTVTVIDYPEIDITSPNSVRSALTAVQPEYVINAAAYTNTHAAEQDEAEADRCFAINVKGTAVLLDVCTSLSIPWLHISTGMIFDGIPPHADGWTEKDTPNPTCWYAKTKYWADLLLLPHTERHGITITRIHTPISANAHPKNLLTKLSGFSSAVADRSSATVLEDYTKVVLALIQGGHTGLFHVVNPGTISPLGITEILKETGHMPKEKEVAPLSMAALNAERGSRAYQPISILSSAKLATIGITIPDIETSIRTILS
jgi:dTDP-4-dehydrorhamnose reductase